MSQSSLAEGISPEALRAIESLRSDRFVSDRAFDLVFPESVRHLSPRYWTPAVVARKACRLLAELGGPVLDVGAGAGKVCVIGALTTSSVFHGIEQRAGLVDIASRVIASLGVGERAKLCVGGLRDVDWSAYRAFYFHNPFHENIFPVERRFDNSVPLSEARLREDAAFVEEILDGLPRHSRIVTFHGLGARIPSTYRLHPDKTRGTAFLKCWIKEEEGRARGDWILDASF